MIYFKLELYITVFTQKMMYVKYLSLLLSACDVTQKPGNQSHLNISEAGAINPMVPCHGGTTCTH